MHASPPFRLFYLHRLDHVPFARVIQAMAQFYRTPNYVVRWVEREREHTLLASVTYHNHTVVLTPILLIICFTSGAFFASG